MLRVRQTRPPEQSQCGVALPLQLLPVRVLWAHSLIHAALGMQDVRAWMSRNRNHPLCIEFEEVLSSLLTSEQELEPPCKPV